MTSPLLEVRALHKVFRESSLFGAQGRVATALDAVDLVIPEGSSVGIVGESGSGKSTLMRCILGLERTEEGEILYQGRSLQQMSAPERRAARVTIQPIFQDPGSSLNPRHRIREIVAEPLLVHRKFSAAERRERVRHSLAVVGLEPEIEDRFPRELSGGQQQRVSIARALVLEPKLVIADEPTASLDVSVQARVLNLLRDLRSQFGLTLMFITHDLAVVRNLCEWVGVMYLGRIVEYGPVEEIFRAPAHPYTRFLLRAIPRIRPASTMPVPAAIPFDILQTQDIPSPFNIPSGCRFRTRCPIAAEICSGVDPAPQPVHREGYAACHMLAPPL